jgi:hypothetical protein
MRPRLAYLVFAFVPSVALAQQATVPDEVRASADQIRAEQLARDLAYLSSDGLLGRNTPSPGFDSAAAYIARRLARAGLTPLGDASGFLQYYDLREQRVDTAAAYLEMDGRRWRFGDDFLMQSFAGPLSGTLPVVYVGHGWRVPEKGVDPYAGLDVRGKVLLVHGPPGAPRGVEIQRIGRVAVGATTPFAEAAQRGAAGILFIANPGAVEGWNRARGANLSRLELDPPAASAYAAIPVTSVLVPPSVTEALLAGGNPSGAELIARAETGDYAPSFELGKPVTVHIPLTLNAVHRPYNVVALIEGGDPALKREYITIASHLDGAVGRAAVNGDSIYNAADDNASGSAATLAIAERMMSAPRPKRSLVFIWDSGEERGLWGTRRFVHQPPVPRESIVAHFNIDMIGANRAPGSPDSAAATVTGPNEVYLTGPGALSPRADSLLTQTNESYLKLEFNRAYDRPESEFFYPRTDAGPFLERGVLTIGFFTGLHERYHRPADEARYLDPQKMERIARTVFAAVWALANADERPRIEKPIPATVPQYR